jgi:replication factor C large subunit
MDWAEKYRPASLGDIIGNSSAVRQIADWAKNWTRKSKPLLLYGKPGIGKTSSAYALANDMKWEVIELNASDQRTAGVIERVAGVGSTTASLTGSSRKLIVIDEADNLQGTSDRGGAKAIVDCIKQAQQPVILIANDLYGISPEIRTRTEPVQFKAIPARSIAPRLKYLCSAEKVTCTDAAIHAIAESAEGDVRSAVNMLYASAIGRDRIDDAQVHTSQKDERISIFSLVPAVFSRISDEELMRISREVEDTPESIEQWIEGNLSLLGDPESISHAYRNLARADEYLGYTYRRQYHTLWRYATAIMLLGVADAAGGRGIHARIMPPERWQKMASARKQKAIRIALLNKIAGVMNIPQSTLREKYIGTLSMIIGNNPLDYARELALDADQLNYFLNDKAKTSEIVKILQLEEKAKEKERDLEKKKIKKEKPVKEEVRPQTRQQPEQEPRQEPKPPVKQPEPEPAEPPAKKSQPPAQSSFDMF